MSTLTFYLILFFVSLSLAALFAFLETAFTTMRLYEVNQLEAKMDRFSKLFSVWRSRPQKLLITILIASNFVDVLSSILVAELMQMALGQQWGLALGVPLATILILIFGNILPKSFAKGGLVKLTPWKMLLIDWLLFLFTPAVMFLTWLTTMTARLFGGGADESRRITEQEIEFLIDYSDEQGIIASDKSEMLQNVFGLGQTTVGSIMIPKTSIMMLDVATPIDQAQHYFSKHKFSRIPVYQQSVDNIIGFIYQKDLFAHIIGARLSQQEGVPLLEQLVRPVVFVEKRKKVSTLLRQFLQNKQHIAIVVDRKGGVAGLATLEDLLEEIVGEINDEHEVHQEGS